MRKHYIRVSAGLLLLLAAWRLDVHAHALVDKAGPPAYTKENYPDGDIDFFDRPDPRTVPDTTEERAAMEQAVRVQWMAVGALVPAVILLIKSGLPLMLRFLAWLLVPDGVRERLYAANPEPQPETAKEAPCGTPAS